MTTTVWRLVTAPFIGAAFCVFLPFIGIALTLYAAGKFTIDALCRVR